MNSLSNFTFLNTFFFLLIKPIFSMQFYDQSKCTQVAQVPGSNYVCNSKKLGCNTFLVYIAQENQTLSSISSLFNMKESDLNISSNPGYQDPKFLYPGREVVIPLACKCNQRFSQGTFSYNNSGSYSLSRIACEVYQGLLKSQTLLEQNNNLLGIDTNDTSTLVQVPVRCACPDVSDVNNQIKYLVTYPVHDGDYSNLIASRFGVAENIILEANGLDPFTTIFPQTTLLIPLKNVPVLNSTVPSIPPSPRAIIPVERIVPGKKLLNHNLAPFIAGIILASVVSSCGMLIFIQRRYHSKRFQSLSPTKMPSSPFSPDFLDGMSKLKHSLISFSLEELRLATEDFSKGSLIGKAVYRGRTCTGGSCLAIEKMNSMESARHVVYILTRINHLNVVKLEGCCYGDKSYLVFEFAENGSLRDCLANVKVKKLLTWAKRLQIACDIAEGLHYIHHCTKPAYVHRNINSRSVLITKDWRAKISGFKLARPLMLNETTWNESVLVGNKGYLAPEYLDHGQASTQVDVYAFGVILLELLSGKGVITEGKWLTDCIGFLAVAGGDDFTSFLENFKGFMDCGLEGNYPMGDAISLALLAKGCTEENPIHRPTMNDLLKALSKIL